MADEDDEDEDDGPVELPPDELARRLDERVVVLANVRVVGVDFSGKNLQEAHLEDAELVDCRFVGADLYAANLCRVSAAGLDFSRATFAKSTMTWADLRGARLDGANLIRAHLSQADLRGASLRGADLRGAFFDGADLTGADLTGATGLDTANGLATAIGFAFEPPATFPRYPGARQLHWGSVSLGPRGGFVWTTYATSDPIADVVAHYQRTLGMTATERDTPAPCWNLGLADEVLTIYAAADHRRFPNGGDGPTADEATVLLISTRPPREEPARNPFAGPFPAPVPAPVEPSRPAPAPSGPRIVYRTVDGHERTVVLDGDEVWVGRRDAAIDTSADPMCGRRHAVIRRGDDGRWSIEDAGSANGVFVNGEKVRAWVLDDGDHIRCGNTELRFISG